MPEPAVVQAMRRFKSQLLLEEQVQMREMGQRWLRVEEALEANLEATSQMLYDMAQAGEEITPYDLFQERRWKHLIAQAATEAAVYAEYADEQITARQRALAVRGVGEAVQAIQLSYQAGVAVDFPRLPVEAVEFMVGGAGNGKPVGELLRTRMVRGPNGQPLPGVWDRLVQRLIDATAAGQNPRVTARRMKDDLAGGLTKALQIARTEQLRVYREAARMQYQESGVGAGSYASGGPRPAHLRGLYRDGGGAIRAG